MAPKILIVLTSQDKIPSNGHPTGWYLPELAHPWEVLHEKAELVIASPKGGEAPLDPASVKMFENDPVASKFLNEQKSLWTNTVKLSDVLPKVSEFDAIFYVGGHGPMFDLVNDETSIALIEAFSAARKPIAAVCHGPTVLLKAKAPSGVPLLSACTVTGFSNTEEDQAQMSSAMPFMLEDELQKVTGNRYVKADEPWGEKVVVSKAAGSGATVITGQNPASATGVGKEIIIRNAGGLRTELPPPFPFYIKRAAVDHQAFGESGVVLAGRGRDILPRSGRSVNQMPPLPEDALSAVLATEITRKKHPRIEC